MFRFSAASLTLIILQWPRLSTEAQERQVHPAHHKIVDAKAHHGGILDAGHMQRMSLPVNTLHGKDYARIT